MSSSGQSQAHAMAQERAQVLRDLLDIARVANGPKPAPETPVTSMETLSESQSDGHLRPSFKFPESSSNSLPPPSPANKEILTTRDVNAIQYTKSQLNEGDTLVIVRFPNGKPVYDVTGFRLSDIHRVHSDKLKAASPIFKQNLEDDWQQHRWRRRNKMLAGLPEGIQYILDLTPPEEGDDALALTAELSCSLGIRRWYKSEFTAVATAHGLVGGKDETTIHPSSNEAAGKSDPASPPDLQENISTAAAVPNVSSVNDINGVRNADVALSIALEESRKLAEQDFHKESDYTRDYSDKEVVALDYCPIRHRTGIERLLQIIEGKDPRLDSAPKVWTLAVLAKHFECHNAVVDYIVTWMIAEPNCKIFEILPEDCLRIGMLLQNEVATRYAFTILVSEEALRIGTGRAEAANQPNTSYLSGKQFTKFGRARESLDEDTLNLIQHAGRNFHARIEQELQTLLNANMNWLHGLQEFTKLLRFKDFLAATPNDARAQNVNKIIDDLINFIRGRLLWCLYQPLDESERKSWNEHRKQERHEVNGNPSDGIYNTLSGDEKLMTRYYWGYLRRLMWQPGHSRCATNLILDSVYPKTPEIAAAEEKAEAAAEALEIPKVYMRDVCNSVDQLNRDILKSIRHENFHKGDIPVEAYKVERLVPKPSTTEGQGHEYRQAQKNPFWIPKPDPVSIKAEPSTPQGMESTPEKPDFWRDALRARDEAIKVEYSSSAIPDTPQVRPEPPDSWLEEVDEYIEENLNETPQDFHAERSANWRRLEQIWKDSKTTPASMPPTSQDQISKLNVSWSIPEDEDQTSILTATQYPSYTRTYVHDPTSTPHVPMEADIGPLSPFFNIHILFNQVEFRIHSVCNAMLSRGEIQNLRPPSCDLCDTLLCLGEDEYKYLPLWANGLNDGTGGVFEETIPPAERGGAVGPGPAYHTGSTVNSSRASTEIDFDGRSSAFGSAVDSDMSGREGVNTSIGVEDGWSVDHVDRRRVFSERDFPTPTTSEDGESVVWVGRDEDEDAEMTMNLPIREKGKGLSFNDEDIPAFATNEGEQSALLASYSDLGSQSDDAVDGKGKGKGKEIDTEMEDVQSPNQVQKKASKEISIDDDDDNFFNTPDGDVEFEFESDDDGEETETEDDFEHIE